MRDRWNEEVELLLAEFQWTINFFQRRAERWEHLATRSQNESLGGPTCYAARQQAIYSRLRDRCRVEWENADPNIQQDTSDSNPFT